MKLSEQDRDAILMFLAIGCLVSWVFMGIYWVFSK